MTNEPTPAEVSAVLSQVAAAKEVPRVITYREWRPKLDLKIEDHEWQRSQSIRAKMRRLLRSDK